MGCASCEGAGALHLRTILAAQAASWWLQLLPAAWKKRGMTRESRTSTPLLLLQLLLLLLLLLLGLSLPQ